MGEIKIYQEYGKEIEKQLRLKTFPLALKMLEKDGDIPAGANRPLQDFGHHLSLCQAFQMSRRGGRTIAMLKEDQWCWVPVVGFGWAEPPDYFMEGRTRQDVATLEAGKHYAEGFPRLEVGKYVGIAMAPLKATHFEPDIVMIYCDSAQLNLLLLGREYKNGDSLKCSISGHAACVFAVTPVLLDGDCNVAVPCRGDRYRAMAGDEEIIFAAPKGKLEDLMVGLRIIDKKGLKLPSEYSSRPEYPMGEEFEKVAKMIGYLK